MWENRLHVHAAGVPGRRSRGGAARGPRHVGGRGRHRGRRRGGDGRRGAAAASPRPRRRWPCSTSGSPTAAGSSCAVSSVRRTPRSRCLMLTSFDDDEALFEAIVAGASGYVLKQVKGSDIIDAVRQVGAGRSLLDPLLTARVMDRLRAGSTEDPRLAGLTAQEHRVLELLADGKTNRQIAAEMFLAEKTVKNYCQQPARQDGDASPDRGRGVRRPARPAPASVRARLRRGIRPCSSWSEPVNLGSGGEGRWERSDTTFHGASASNGWRPNRSVDSVSSTTGIRSRSP